MESSRSKAEDVLKEIEGLSRKKFLPIVGPIKGQILIRMVREVKPKRVLEVGTLIGYSAILIGKEMERGAHLITIEINPDAARIAEKNIRIAEIPPAVEVLIGDALEVIPRLEGEFDLVFLDAEKSEYLNYLQLIENKLHKGSVIVADNVQHAPDYLSYVRFSGKYASKFIPVGWDGLEISVKL